ncbi:MAG TPA: GAF and ANTAR domain-containing protein [Acidothermaceae bacterium]|nr:GAF and ANTAR domain-containing protein [Acidothermaceae bacterium]
MRRALGDAVAGGDPAVSMADRLCLACVQLLGVDGAAISVMLEGTSQGTVGASGELSRRLDELQFTFGEGPCIDAVRRGGPVIVEDLADPAEQRWPVYSGPVVGLGVRAVYALPIRLANSVVGALDLYRHKPGPLEGDSRIGGVMAAELAVLPVLALLADGADSLAVADSDAAWDQLGSLARVEVYQATGMVMGQLNVGPAEALVRLRAHAFVHGLTASEVAWSIVGRRLSLEPDDEWPNTGRIGGAA